MENIIKISETKPENFSDKNRAALCYVKHGDRLLLLKRSEMETLPGCWGLPGGRLETDEIPIIGAKRELFEETGLLLSPLTPLLPLGHLYSQKQEGDLTFHLFLVNLLDLPPITLSEEHSTYLWTSHEERGSLKLIEGFHELYRFVQKRSENR